MTRHIDDVNQYIADVLSDNIPVCLFVKQACQRHLDDLQKPDFDYHFDESKAERVCKFVELMPHIKGKWAGKPIKLEPWQKFILAMVFGWVDYEGYRRFKIAYTEVARKNAKALALDTLIPTPEGAIPIRDLSPGDLVYGSNGSEVRVTGVSPTFRDRQCYRIKFANGQEVVCDGEHDWLTTAFSDKLPGDPKGGYKHGQTTSRRVRSTSEIYRTRFRGSRLDNNHKVTVSEPIDGRWVEFPVNPYSLGAWLGDGHSAGSRITSMDHEIISELRRIEGECTELVSGNIGGKAKVYRIGKSYREGEAKAETFQGRLRSIGVLNEKHIPEQYFSGSKLQRLQLLSGLMDTDGTCLKSGQCVYAGINQRLCRGVHRLVSSLGMKASMVESLAKCGDYSVKAYKVQFWAYSDNPVFKVERKRERQKPRPQKPTRASSNIIVSVEPCPSVETRCISVDAEDSLFLCTESYIPTHNSTLTSGVANYMTAADDEGGAECFSAATTRDQARIVFNDAKAMADKSAGFRAKFGVKTSAHSVYQESTSSSFKSISAEADSLDGLNVHFASVDELHAHKTRKVWDVLETATGSRTQPLIWAITTSGSNRAGICYEQRDYVKRILSGKHVDEEYFGIIYSVDDEDLATDVRHLLFEDENLWRKANPNFGVSVNPDDIARKARKAREMTSAQNNFLTKHLDVWVNADTAWMNMPAWDACEQSDLSLDQFKGEPCNVGLDLASKLDIMAKVSVFRREVSGKPHYYVFGKYFLPMDAIENSPNSQYEGWELEGRLIASEGATNDFDLVESEMLSANSDFMVKNFAYDPNQAAQLQKRMTDEGLNMLEIRQSVANFSEAMKEIEALVLENRIHFCDDPVLSWMMSNVVCHTNAKDEIYPRKEFDDNKIDGVVALIMAMRCWINGEDEEPGNVYEERGLRTL